MSWSKIASGAIGAAGSILGGMINGNNAAAQMAQQREFAQNGIRWKVADAKAAGIHPLAALGAQTFSYNPVMTGDNGISEALARMGQGVDRAAHAKALAEERALDRQLTEAQIRNVNAQTDAVQAQAAQSKAALAKSALPPPMPPVNDSRAPVGQNVDKPLNKYQWVRNAEGKIELMPSSEYAQLWEDKPFGADLLPILEAGARSLYGKFTGTPIDGRRWSWSVRNWIPDNKGVHSRAERRGVDYFSNSYRYR